MIVDCYTHIWDSPRQLGLLADSVKRRANFPAAAGGDRTGPNAGAARHLAASQQVDASVVLGFKSTYLEAEIPNNMVAEYVNAHPDRLIGFAGVDPTIPSQAAQEMERARTELGMRGIALSPAAQNLHPCDSRAEAIYELAVNAGMPVLFHPGIQIARECKLEFAQPVLLDEVARDHPGLKMIIAHLGYPWVKETLVLLAKHDNVHADISWLLHQPLEAYQALLSAYQYDVIDKLLFGSGFPYNSPAQSIETLYGINHLCSGTNLPGIPREALRGIVERDALQLLGIGRAPSGNRPLPPPSLLDDGDQLA